MIVFSVCVLQVYCQVSPDLSTVSEFGTGGRRPQFRGSPSRVVRSVDNPVETCHASVTFSNYIFPNARACQAASARYSAHERLGRDPPL